ncbi:hypothetical protein BDN72DRAFT_430335 [Pluteus cervinus]|uniref:Uncharacterized protein n=1 Tax=Pluteus cervinus TaxID=181527 RepID=A0ACD3A766_9AGAR|nr:hypothetical protein BDN72DRAFT_430335 [Pluteus cervinus]
MSKSGLVGCVSCFASFESNRSIQTTKSEPGPSWRVLPRRTSESKPGWSLDLSIGLFLLFEHLYGAKQAKISRMIQQMISIGLETLLHYFFLCSSCSVPGFRSRSPMTVSGSRLERVDE